MKILIEEYPYAVKDVEHVLDGLFTLQDVEQRVQLSYVGYYYNPKPEVRDVVYILPKVLMDENNKVFGHYAPEDVINLDKSKLTDTERDFIYEFAVWVHRAIVVFNDSNENTIVLHKTIENAGHGGKRKTAETLLDVILALIRFNKENQQYFTFILKNLHSGFNKINWQKTISRTHAIVQGGKPIYLDPVNKKRQINFDEELIIIYFSILQYVADRYGFRSKIQFGFPLITGAKFQRYRDGYGAVRLRQIKYKYFSDTAVKLWNLCMAFFDMTHRLQVNSTQNEYLLVKSFYVVFEAIIDNLVGVPHDQIPFGLADQPDGKLVDHFYTYEGLLLNKPDDDIYYIGDSKYYKMGGKLGTESIYKQRTYARNVIQWNLDIHASADFDPEDRYQRIQIFDKLTEGYNVIPNFFISAKIDRDLSYADRTRPHVGQDLKDSYHFRNRLYDRDTLLLSHYDVNFLYVLSLYARDNSSTKLAWRKKIRAQFRKAVQDMLAEKYDFYAMRSLPAVDGMQYIRDNFQSVLGKVFSPYGNTDNPAEHVFSLALEKTDTETNHRLLAELGQYFDLAKLEIGEDPSGVLPERVFPAGPVGTADDLVLVSGLLDTEEFDNIKAKKLYYARMAGGNNRGAIALVSGFEKCRWLIIHCGKRYQLLELKGGAPLPYSAKTLHDEFNFNPSSPDAIYIGFKLVDGKEKPTDGLNLSDYGKARIIHNMRPTFFPLADLQQDRNPKDNK